jgi:hypothetical protein
MTEKSLRGAQERFEILENEKNRRVMLRQKIQEEKNQNKNFRINMKNYKSGQSRYEYKAKISNLKKEVGA